ncbi:hypothetical protein ACF09L_32555 [Streptomyces sp. NPDC014779]|uniref:hypothetical protein n=1 Tax=Streptomyces sp. NPDC014779 TaxID=3364911 RepID=UPI003700F5D0
MSRIPARLVWEYVGAREALSRAAAAGDIAAFTAARKALRAAAALYADELRTAGFPAPHGLGQ